MYNGSGDNMSNHRLFQILFILLEKGSTTAPELAERFEVSVRTIYRDIDNLSSAGIPVYTTQGKGGGIYIQENYVLNKSLISDDEQTQILSALQGLGVIDKSFDDDLLSKLGGMFDNDIYDWIEVDYSNWDIKSEKDFSVIKEAIFKRNKISFDYYSEASNKTSRVVDPHKLIFKSHMWYLYGYCNLKKEFRLFKLSRIRDLKMCKDTFERRSVGKFLKPQEIFKESEIEVTLLFDKDMSYRVYDFFENVEITSEGKYLVKGMFQDYKGLYSFVLSFGEKVEVISPKSVREEILKIIEKVQKFYKT